MTKLTVVFQHFANVTIKYSVQSVSIPTLWRWNISLRAETSLIPNTCMSYTSDSGKYLKWCYSCNYFNILTRQRQDKDMGYQGINPPCLCVNVWICGKCVDIMLDRINLVVVAVTVHEAYNCSDSDGNHLVPYRLLVCRKTHSWLGGRTEFSLFIVDNVK
jgi:hypothetical protein